MYCVLPMGDDLVGLGDPEIMRWAEESPHGLVFLLDISMLKPPPSEKYASRQDLRDHVEILKKSFLDPKHEPQGHYLLRHQP